MSINPELTKKLYFQRLADQDKVHKRRYEVVLENKDKNKITPIIETALNDKGDTKKRKLVNFRNQERAKLQIKYIQANEDLTNGVLPIETDLKTTAEKNADRQYLIQQSIYYAEDLLKDTEQAQKFINNIISDENLLRMFVSHYDKIKNDNKGVKNLSYNYLLTYFKRFAEKMNKSGGVDLSLDKVIEDLTRAINNSDNLSGKKADEVMNKLEALNSVISNSSNITNEMLNKLKLPDSEFVDSLIYFLAEKPKLTNSDLNSLLSGLANVDKQRLTDLYNARRNDNLIYKEQEQQYTTPEPKEQYEPNEPNEPQSQPEETEPQTQTQQYEPNEEKTEEPYNNNNNNNIKDDMIRKLSDLINKLFDINIGDKNTIINDFLNKLTDFRTTIYELSYLSDDMLQKFLLPKLSDINSIYEYFYNTTDDNISQESLDEIAKDINEITFDRLYKIKKYDEGKNTEKATIQKKEDDGQEMQEIQKPILAIPDINSANVKGSDIIDYMNQQNINIAPLLSDLDIVSTQHKKSLTNLLEAYRSINNNGVYISNGSQNQIKERKGAIRRYINKKYNFNIDNYKNLTDEHTKLFYDDFPIIMNNYLNPPTGSGFRKKQYKKYKKNIRY